MLLDETVKKFTSFCRTGNLDPNLAVDPVNIQIYFQLIRNHFEDALRRAFPLTHHVLNPDDWEEIVSDFFAIEDCPSPFFWKMPEGFSSYIKKNQWAKRLKIPYLNDLVDFEWLEIEIFMMPDCLKESYRKKGSVLEDLLYFNPESQVVVYQYPVFEKKTLPRTMEKGTYPVLVYRHPEKGTVHFISLSPFFQKVVELLKKECLTGREACLKAAKKFKLKEEEVLPTTEKFLSELLAQKAIHGFLN